MENVPNIRNSQSTEESIDKIHRYLVGLKQELEYQFQTLTPQGVENLINMSDIFKDKTNTDVAYWDRISDITDDLGRVISEKLAGNIRTSTNKILNGTSTVEFNEQGIYIHDKETEEESTWAMKIGAQGFMIANGKKANAELGSWEWEWTTFGTGDGFTADSIVSGTLDTITLNACTILATAITSGTISGVSIFGSTIKIGDIEAGNYIEISPGNPLKVWRNKKTVASLGYSTIGGGNLTIYDGGGTKAFHVEVLEAGNLQIYANSDRGYIPDPNNPGFWIPNPNPRYLQIDSAQVLFSSDQVGYIATGGSFMKFTTSYDVNYLIYQSANGFSTGNFSNAIKTAIDNKMQTHINNYHSSISDKRLKSNISYMDTHLLLEFCKKVKPSTFYITNDETKRERIGLIAQDIMSDEIGQYFVKPIPGDEEHYMIDYETLSVAALGAIQEMQKKYDMLEERILKLEKGV